MGQSISKLTIKGFKSIRCLQDFELRNLNVLIGPNGAGKSNFLSFFELLRAVAKGQFQLYVVREGGADRVLFLGSKMMTELSGSIELNSREVSWEFKTFASKTNELLFYEEDVRGGQSGTGAKWDKRSGHGLSESILFSKSSDVDMNEYHGRIKKNIQPIMKHWISYHFHDTGDFAAVKRRCTIRDYEYLRPDASNLAAFLLFLKKKHEKVYQRIRETIQLAAPFFDEFLLREEEIKDDKQVLLEWMQKGSDYPFLPSQISDGTLRFICLATALLQPNPPSTIILDEPELGLHPHALGLLAEMIQAASLKTQVIVATQSASLISHFAPEDIIVVERKNEESVFRRLPLEKLKEWVGDYSLGELWEMNLLEGRQENE